MNHYSQNNEQEVLLEELAGKTDGRFLDLGAFDAKAFSNTRALYELGWNGVMVEPSPGPFRALVKEYGYEPRITLVHAAVGLVPKMVTMYASDDALSCCGAAQHKRAEAEGYKFYGSFAQPVISLGYLCANFGLKYDFVSIDIEGTSADLFLYALTMISPKCWCVEHDGRFRELEEKARRQYGYRLASQNGENCIFVREGA